MNKNINVIIEYLKLCEEFGTDNIYLSGADIRVLNDYIRTQNEKIKQLRDLSIYLDKELTNITKEIEEIEL